MRMGPGYQESGRKNQFKMTQQIHWDHSSSKVPEDPMTQVFPLMARSNLIKVDFMKKTSVVFFLIMFLHACRAQLKGSTSVPAGKCPDAWKIPTWKAESMFSSEIQLSHLGV